MKNNYFILVLVSLIASAFSCSVKSQTFLVSSLDEFEDALDDSSENDTIVWENGTYEDINMEISVSHLHIKAEISGQVIFTGESKVDIEGNNIIFEGFQFLDGDIGTSDVINTTGDNLLITQINIKDYTSYKYLRIREASQYVDVTYCNFENRLNLDDQNILSILVDDNTPGYHKVQYCSFKNFDGTGNDMGIEPIRIGLSTQADRISRSVVEYCYFTECDGDGELISSKASQNVYRFNTFENNTKAELVLRHGSEGIVYGNFFLNGKGGVRVREGQNHYIYNNYFQNIEDRAIYLQNEDSDPLDNINVAFNTITNCSEVILGGDGPDEPTNVIFSNNIFTDPQDDLFEDATGTETWIGNIIFGSLGISAPSSGLTTVNPMLEENSAGFFGLSSGSPAIDASSSGYALLPNFEGIEGIDVQMLFDLMGQERPSEVSLKDIGCSEFPHNTLIQPIATEANTGPFYISSGTDPNSVTDLDNSRATFISVYPNPAVDYVTISLENKTKSLVYIDVLNALGEKVSSVSGENAFSGKQVITHPLTDLPSGIYIIEAAIKNSQTAALDYQRIKFVKQ